MRVLNKGNRHPVIERISLPYDEKTEELYYKDRFRFNLYKTNSDNAELLRTIEIRLNTGLVWVEGEFEPMAVTVYSWYNIEDGNSVFALHRTRKQIVETLSGWLQSMTLIASPSKIQFTLTENESVDIISSFLWNFEKDRYTRDFERVIKILD